MEILVARDLIVDDLGNYYVAYAQEDNKLYITNAFQYYSFNRILNDAFVDDVEQKYARSVAVGQYFLDSLRNKIEGLERKNYPGGIYNLNEVTEYYDIEYNPFYEKNFTVADPI